MKSLYRSIFIYVFLNIALVHSRRGRNDWFWDKNFSDGSEHDNDPEREFFRDQDDYTYRPQPIDGPTTWPEPLPTEEPTTWYEPEQPSDEPTPWYDPGTSDDPTPEPEQPTEKPTTRLDPAKEYYKKRKAQALNCEGNEQTKINLDGITCQVCTCNGQGVLFCSKIPCHMDDSGMKTGHKHMLQSASNTNAILREYATDCRSGARIYVGPKCTCTCVLEGVMSCPKHCFFDGDFVPTGNKDLDDPSDVDPSQPEYPTSLVYDPSPEPETTTIYKKTTTKPKTTTEYDEPTAPDYVESTVWG